ncbi:MAG: VWA domain-containing protein [Planctomycetota bacterium]
MRAGAVILLLALPGLAGGEATFLLRDVKTYDPSTLPKSERRRTEQLKEEAWRKAKSNYGGDAAEYVPEYYEKLNLPRKLELLAERGKRQSEALAVAGGPDHSTATKLLCDLFGALQQRRREVEKARNDLDEEFRSLLISKKGAKRLSYKSGTKPRALAIQTDRLVLREQAYQLLGLQTECSALLGKKKAEDSLLYLERTALLKAKEPRLRVLVARALAARPETELSVLLRALAKEKDASIKAAHMDSVSRMGDRARDSIESIVGYVEDPSERVRIATARALTRLHVPEGVEPLVMRIGKESGRTRVDFACALESLTGETIGSDPLLWERWWEANKGTILNDGLPPPGGQKDDPRAQRWKGEGGFYYGLPQVSQRIIYVIDISDSMNYMHEGQRRLERCKSEVKGAIGNLPRAATFAVIAFNNEIRPWKETMSRATPANKESAGAFIDELRAKQFTNIYDALHEAFRIAGEGSSKKDAPIRADTIYLLTDGAPTKPDASLDSVETILAAARDWNALSRVTIHTIGIGKGLKFSFLKRLAEEHHGEFIRREW